MLENFGNDPLFTTVNQVIDWAKNNIDYILGVNSYSYSFLIGFGLNYPLKPHH